MPLDRLQYVPTLAFQYSEMVAVRRLPRVTKDRMTPCFLLPPFLRPKHLTESLEIIERAYHQKHYFLDIDRYYSSANKENNVTSEDLASFLSVVLQSSMSSMSSVLENELRSRYGRRMSERDFDKAFEKAEEEWQKFMAEFVMSFAKEAINLAEASIYDDAYKRTLIQANLKWGEKESGSKKN